MTLPAAHLEWQKVYVPINNVNFKKMKLSLSQKNLGDFVPADGLCTFAAISDEPNITEKTKIAVFNHY